MKKLDKNDVRLMKKWAKKCTIKEHESTGFPELDKMIDDAAERITKEINESPELLKAWREEE